jgi:hypothetical protein
MSREKWEKTLEHFLRQYEYAIEFNKQVDLEPGENYSEEYLDRRRGILWAASRIAKLEKVAEAAKETRDASAALCRVIFYDSPGLIKKLPSQYDGFGQRIDTALRELEEK